MKKNLSKIGVSMIATAAIVGGIFFAGAQNAPATSTQVDQGQVVLQKGEGLGMMGGYGMMNRDENGNWSMKGQWGGSGDNVKDFGMLKSIFPALALGFIGAGIVLTIIALLLIAFWVWMLVHAIKHDIEYKPIWILVLGIMGILGAIIYYFAVKRQYVCYCGQEGMCDCEDCTCGKKEGEKCGVCGEEECKCKK
jgi:hypothetical protein